MKQLSLTSLHWLNNYGEAETLRILRRFKTADGSLYFAVELPNGKLKNLSLSELVKVSRNNIAKMQSQLEMLEKYPNGLPDEGHSPTLKKAWELIYRLLASSPYLERKKLTIEQTKQNNLKRILILSGLIEWLEQILEQHKAGFLQFDTGDQGKSPRGKLVVPLSVAARECYKKEMKGNGAKTREFICTTYLESHEIKGKPNYSAKQLAGYIATAKYHAKL
jgi:hypothetical protein